MSRAHADALAEAGRLREIVQEIASCGYFDPDPEYKRIRYVEVQIDRSTMEAINECLTSTPTTAEWVEARDKAIRESLEKEVTELRKELAAVREVEESQDRGLAAIYATVEKAIGRGCWHSQMEAVEDLAGRYADAQKNAGRYRTLRDRFQFASVKTGESYTHRPFVRFTPSFDIYEPASFPTCYDDEEWTPEMFDAAIDAAREGK